MSDFDPTKPIKDPKVWYPQGMYISQGDNGQKTFLLAKKDMGSLNRYVMTGRMLPTDRTEYTSTIGVADTSVISDEVWGAVDNLLRVYKTIKTDSSDFQDNTWDGIVELASNIYTYASKAGGTDESSYYYKIMEWVKNYNEANTDDEREKYAADITYAAKKQLGIVTDLQRKAETARTDLGVFHDKCVASKGQLDGSANTMQTLLKKENSDIETLTKEIEDAKKALEPIQKRIDEARLREQHTEYYSWIPIVGTIAAIAVIALAEEEIASLRDSLNKIMVVINSDQAKLQAANALQGDITGMGTDVDSLLGIIAPAISILEDLQGAWKSMSTKLEVLMSLFEDETEGVPPMDMAETDLQSIIEEWNALRDDADAYIKEAYNIPQPSKTSIQNYVNQLDDHLQKLKN
ncbi:uncharacterized protein ASPGLDRAFT_31525 [Aspergillus glaucus CBS 516.65]|uniref:Pesticidal crystal protein cry6Aa n=1 Tax=Aspergillus glaucus CBS 516.65 TaxID=1160497 RepID=A0A1L9VWU3_ASPGL|nr:hypothetical protein ASPGLDRAFT_31525 [Aspergillus glaucus CBS 516.65]OJJ88372.1 hypothetical protein ASPGLDRAFT_31525 [Aspergillus glaucus CBS 516.65]